MPAQQTAEYDLTGLSGQTLYDKFKAMLIESGGVIFDEYAVGGTLYLVEQVSVPGSPDVYARWHVNGTTISAPAFFRGWAASSHAGANQMTPVLNTALATGYVYARMYTIPGKLRMLGVGHATVPQTQTFGWFVPDNAPIGWPSASYPFMASGIGYNVPLAAQSAVPQLNGLNNSPSCTCSQMPLPGTVDGTLTGTLFRYPAVVAPHFGQHLYPDDFLVITGRASTDFSSLRGADYTVNVNGETRTYRALYINGTYAFCLRMS